jgi:transcriptional regulator with XRE-family HTH domain
MSKATQIDKEIGKKIELQRLIKRRSRIWLGGQIKKSYQQVQNYENGKHRVSASTLFEISNLLKVSISEFFPQKNENKEVK